METQLILWALKSWWLFPLVFVLAGLRVINQYQRAVKFRLGKYVGTLSPGLTWIIPVIEWIQKVDIRVVTVDVHTQECVTKDNISIKVNAVLYFRIKDASHAVLEVEDYLYAVSQLAQTTMRNIVGQFELDTLLSEREKISGKIREIVDKATDPWGIDVRIVELKDIELPENMKRAIARQAEAERERRARITLAEGELQAADKLQKAGEIVGKTPTALQLRFYQTLAEIAAEKNSTTIVTVPVEILEAFKKIAGEKK